MTHHNVTQFEEPKFLAIVVDFKHAGRFEEGGNAPLVLLQQTFTYKRYEELKRELDDLNKKKKEANIQLARLERDIYNFEGAYLSETIHHGGNLIHGFDNYLKSNNSLEKRKKLSVHDADRLFSLSSATYEQSLQLKDESSSAAEDYKTPNKNGRRKKRKFVYGITSDTKRLRSSRDGDDDLEL